MKKYLNVLCVIISLVFIIFGLTSYSNILYNNETFAIAGVANAVLGGFLILSGTLGLLFQIYLYNQKK